MRRAWAVVLAMVFAVGFSGRALAEKEVEHGQHGAAPSGEHGGHADHLPGPINWYYGMISEKDGVEPSVLFRPKGTPPPLLAMLINTALLYFVLFKIFRRPVIGALKKRKQTVMQGIETAAKMKEDAAERLDDYEDKLAHIDEEIERVKREMREAGEADRVRILAEAKERRQRMERDARLLIDQELKAARQDLLKETIDSAIKSASERIAKELSQADHQRLADDYLAGLDRSLANAKVGRV